MTLKPSVTFFQISTNDQKLSALFHIVKEYFENNKVLVIKSPSEQAAKFIDEFIWKVPGYFIPHSISNTPLKEFIIITSEPTVELEAHGIFNLVPSPIQKPLQYQKIYELDDNTSSQKTAQSKKHYKEYEKMGFPIVSL